MLTHLSSRDPCRPPHLSLIHTHTHTRLSPARDPMALSPPSDPESASPPPPPPPQDPINNTPTSPTNTTPTSTTTTKRKPSRRANTAERRATHNAVERQRRETLNGRFLVSPPFFFFRLMCSHEFPPQDLAALLPNLSQIRRPSKSSIVNSSIAHIHASRRHRMLAARELRMLKHETDALRREINEWRNRAGIPSIEEPVRSDGFSMVLSGELEVIAAIPGEEDNEDDNDYPGYEDEFPAVVHVSHGHPRMDELDDPRMASMIKPGHFNPNVSVPSTANALPLAHILPRPSAGPPIMASPTPYDGSNIYEAHHGLAGSPTAAPGFMQHQPQQSIDADKMAWYGTQPHQQLMQPQQRSLYTPPASNGNGAPSPVSGSTSTGSKPPSPATTHPFNDPSSHPFFTNPLPRHQQGYASDEGNVGTNGSSAKHISVHNPLPINLATSNRGPPLSTASHGPHSIAMASPDGASPVSPGAGSPVYDGSFTIHRPPPNAPNNSWRDQAPPQHAQNMMGMGMGGGMMMNGMGMGSGLVGNAMGTMVSVGGGGNGGGFAMMM